jgi:hypothetical protein
MTCSNSKATLIGSCLGQPLSLFLRYFFVCPLLATPRTGSGVAASAGAYKRSLDRANNLSILSRALDVIQLATGAATCL